MLKKTDSNPKSYQIQSLDCVSLLVFQTVTEVTGCDRTEVPAASWLPTEWRFHLRNR